MKSEEVIERFTQESVRILRENLVGVYLHGSAVMGCFQPKKSDLDFIVVVKEMMSNDVKKAFMEMIVALNAEGPAKGIEMSIVRREVCDPFVYPTPFELHFSVGCLGWYLEDPEGFIQKMNGTDKDLAAHFTVIRTRGKCLYGAPIEEVLGEVPQQDYIDSIWYDIENAADEIDENTMYLTLNLARVLAYLKEKKVLSKQEGGEWGIRNLPEKYHGLLREALREYQGEEPAYNMELAKEYAQFMLTEIQKLKKDYR
ncbi:MAG: DUF4111 domain-containing protein [Lachnospiraceae bacterium]|nr:DUF4111 domain-containing protein [Lachnospiraceae bacterium]